MRFYFSKLTPKTQFYLLISNLAEQVWQLETDFLSIHRILNEPFAKALFHIKASQYIEKTKKMRISFFLPLFGRFALSFQKNNADDSLEIFLSSKGS